MKLFNNTKKTVIADDVIVPKTLLEQTIGLLKYKSPVAMLLKTRFGIHTLDMKYPIDVLILDKENKVVALKGNLKPNRIFLWHFKYDTVLELPVETIVRTKTQIGDKILL